MPNGSSVRWGSDVLVSMPEPPPADLPRVVHFGGFAFTPNGLVPDLTQADLDNFMQPLFAPVNPPDGDV